MANILDIRVLQFLHPLSVGFDDDTLFAILLCEVNDDLWPISLLKPCQMAFDRICDMTLKT